MLCRNRGVRLIRGLIGGALTDDGLADVEDISAGHEYLDAEHRAAIARDDLGQQLEVAHFLRANEGGEVIPQAVELEQLLIRCVTNREGAAAKGVSRLWA